MAKRIYEINYGVRPQALIETTNWSTNAPKLLVVRGDTIVVRMNIYVEDNQGWKLSQVSAFAAGLGDPGLAPLATSTVFNQGSDWGSIDAHDGKICFRMDLSGAALKADMDNGPTSNYVMTVRGTVDGRTFDIAVFPLTVRNIIEE